MGISADSEEDLIQLFSHFKLHRDCLGLKSKGILVGRPDMLKGTKFKNPEDLFKSLGADVVDCLDISGFEGANIVHDMNSAIPRNLEGQYSLVYDNGTMEHCFDIKQFLFNVNAMLHKGGLVFHGNPFNNYSNHGFYTFSPCLYLGFYIKNKYKILDITITGTQKHFNKSRPPEYRIVGKYTFRGRDLIPLINTPRVILEKAVDPSVMWTISFLARKQTDSLISAIPQQPIYDPFIKRTISNHGILWRS